MTRGRSGNILNISNIVTEHFESFDGGSGLSTLTRRVLLVLLLEIVFAGLSLDERCTGNGVAVDTELFEVRRLERLYRRRQQFYRDNAGERVGVQEFGDRVHVFRVRHERRV